MKMPGPGRVTLAARGRGSRVADLARRRWSRGAGLRPAMDAAACMRRAGGARLGRARRRAAGFARAGRGTGVRASPRPRHAAPSIRTDLKRKTRTEGFRLSLSSLGWTESAGNRCSEGRRGSARAIGGLVIYVCGAYAAPPSHGAGSTEDCGAMPWDRAAATARLHAPTQTQTRRTAPATVHRLCVCAGRARSRGCARGPCPTCSRDEGGGVAAGRLIRAFHATGSHGCFRDSWRPADATAP